MAWHDSYRNFGGYSSEEDERYGNYGYMERQQYQQRAVKVERRYACTRCNKDYATKANLERHVASEHAPKPKALQGRGGGEMVPWSPQGTKFPCRYCGNEYASQGNLNRHVTSVHVKGGQGSVASSTHNTKIVYNMYTQNFYNCKKY